MEYASVIAHALEACALSGRGLSDRGGVENNVLVDNTPGPYPGGVFRCPPLKLMIFIEAFNK